MTRRLTALIAAALLPACASMSGAQQKKEEPHSEKLSNLSYFDVGVCHTAVPKVPEKVTDEVMLGVLLSAQPQVLECLVDPANRGPAESTKVVIDSVPNDTGVTHAVTGENLTPAGTQCITAELNKLTQALPTLTAKNAYPRVMEAGKPPKPVSGHVEVEHKVGALPAVSFGSAEGSDYVGHIRLAERTWCDCYEPWKDTAPRALTAKIDIVKPVVDEKAKKEAKAAGKPEPIAATTAHPTVTFQPTNDPASDQVAACLAQKMGAMELKLPSGASYGFAALPFNFVHSGVTEGTIAGASAGAQLIQYDLIRARRTAEAAIVIGEQAYAGGNYDTLVANYGAMVKNKKIPQKQLDVAVKELKEKCAGLLKADDKVTGALDAQLTIDAQTRDYISAQKASSQDPKWGEAEASANEKVAVTTKQVEDAKKIRAAHAGICPKERY